MKVLNSGLRVGAIVLFAAMIFSSCKKNEDTYSYTQEREDGMINDWVAAMGEKNYNVDTTSAKPLYITDKEGTGGLLYILHNAGTGDLVKAGDTLTVNYTGYYMDGSIFDASTYHGGSMTYIHKSDSSRMIPGWEEGIELLAKGGKVTFCIPSSKAYGSAGYLSIPPYTPLIFDIEVVDIKPISHIIDYTQEREDGLIKDWKASMIAKKLNIETSSNGLLYIIDKEGTGDLVKAGDTLTVKYTSYFMDGSIFNTSESQSNKSMTYVHKADSSRMITGWEEGVELLKKGSKAAFCISSAKAYGTSGNAKIPPYTPLISVIEVVEIK